MEKHKHTPGSWERAEFYSPSDGKMGSSAITRSGDLGILAHVYIPAKGRPSHDEGMANAHLIAAAPDLLAACRLALKRAEGWIHDQLDGTGCLDEELKELEPVRHAIAKAEGGTQ